jgi:acetyl esterase/lipase
VTARAITGVTRSAVLALGLLAPAGPPPPVTPSTMAQAPPVWVLCADRQSPAAPYVGVIGDSTGSQLALAVADRLRHRDVGVVIATVGGCQPTDVALTYQGPDYLRSHRNCIRDAPEKQREMTARYHPKVVIWSDIMEWSDIQAEDGRTVTAGTDEWRRLILASWDRLLARLSDARLALVLPNWWAGWPAVYPAGFPVGRQRALFR